MATDEARLTKLSIEGFRGFREAITLDLDASAVLLWGPNGTGKTSVFDALEWLLVGDVVRLSRYTLRRNDEYLANIYRPHLPARVEADLRLPGVTLHARRTGNARGSTLELKVGDESHVGPDAERLLAQSLLRGESPLSEVLATSGLLQQDELRQLLETKPDERYRRLLRLLGLEVLGRFDRYAAALRDRARADTRKTRELLERLRADTERLKERLDTSRLQVEMASVQEVNVSSLSVSADRFADVFHLTMPLGNAEELASLGSSARSAASLVQSQRSQLAELPEALPPSANALLEQTSALRAEAEVALEAARVRRAEAQEAVRAAEVVQDAVGRLAAAALPLLEMDKESASCPVCGTAIDPHEVARELSARVASAASVAAAQTLMQSAIADASREEARLEELLRNEEALRVQEDRRRVLVESLRRAVSALQTLQAAPPSPLLTISGDLGLVESEETDAGSHASDASSDPHEQLFSAWALVRTERLQHLERLSDGLLAVADSADAAAAAGSASRLAAERGAAIPRLEVQYAEAEARLRAQEKDYEETRRKETAAVLLSQRATEAAAELFRERFDALEPLMNDIYARLDPHPAFTRLDFRVETYRSRGTATANVVDDEELKEANPMLVFSSAQANAVVLSAFLALGWAAGDRGLPFVLLDDPLQAMDDVNVLGFADLARRVRRQRQIVLATHEERFASLLERKLTGRLDGEDLLVHRFVGWTRSGPVIETRRVTPRTDLQLRIVAS